jgi:hypothetical protein
MHDDRAAYVVAGPAGVGKTRLVAEVARAATAQGRASLHVVATMAARSIPFGAFAPLLGDVDASPSTLVGALRQAGDAIAARLENRAGLLVIDDAQNLDDGSSALVHHLARDRTCGLITSLRTPGTAPDLVTARWKDGLAVRVDLEPLTRTGGRGWPLGRSALPSPEVGCAGSGKRRTATRCTCESSSWQQPTRAPSGRTPACGYCGTRFRRPSPRRPRGRSPPHSRCADEGGRRATGRG